MTARNWSLPASLAETGAESLGRPQEKGCGVLFGCAYTRKPDCEEARGARREALGLRGVVHVVGGPDVLRGRALAALLRPEERVLQRPARAACEAVAPPLPLRRPLPRQPTFQQPCPRWAPGLQPPQPGPRYPKAPPTPWPPSPQQLALRHAPPPARAAPPCPGGAAAALVPPRQLRVLVRGLGVRKPSSRMGRVLQRRGLGSSWSKSFKVEVARDERRGLAVRLIQGQRLIPLKVAHHLLKARALIEAVGPKRLHLFTVAQLRPPPVPRPGARPARSAAGVPGGAAPACARPASC